MHGDIVYAAGHKLGQLLRCTKRDFLLGDSILEGMLPSWGHSASLDCPLGQDLSDVD